MESGWLFINVDELLYRLHLYVAEPIISFFSFGWLFRDSGAARAIDAGQLGVAADASFWDRWFLSPLYRIISSRPSEEHDSLQEALNPTGDKSVWEIISGILFGTGDKESIFGIIFGSFFGWVLIAAIVGLAIRYYLKQEIGFMKKHKALLYDLSNRGHVQTQANDKRARWEQIVSQVNSTDVNQWKIAVLDADSLLDDVLYEQGYAGDGVATKLRSAREDNLETLHYAQEAHAIRNRIAHDSGYALSHREAKLAISSYERFFNELYHM